MPASLGLCKSVCGYGVHYVWRSPLPSTLPQGLEWQDFCTALLMNITFFFFFLDILGRFSGSVLFYISQPLHGMESA